MFALKERKDDSKMDYLS